MSLEIKEYNYQIPPINDVKKIMKTCNWWKIVDSEFEKLFESSSAIFVAYQDGNAIGTARVISDNVVYALIVDVLVDPDFRDRGVGTALVEKIFDYVKKADLKIIKLLSTSKGKSLYEKFGFKMCSSKEPGMIKIVKQNEETVVEKHH